MLSNTLCLLLLLISTLCFAVFQFLADDWLCAGGSRRGFHCSHAINDNLYFSFVDDIVNAYDMVMKKTPQIKTFGVSFSLLNITQARKGYGLTQEWSERIMDEPDGRGASGFVEASRVLGGSGDPV